MMYFGAYPVDETYYELVKWVRQSKIKVKPFGDRKAFNEMRKQIGIGVISSNKGLPIDVWWMEASESMPGTFDPDVMTEEDMFIQLHEKLLYARSVIAVEREAEGMVDPICHDYIFDPETSIEDATLYYVDKVLRDHGYECKLTLKKFDEYTLIKHRNCVICGLSYGKEKGVDAIMFMGLTPITRKKITKLPLAGIKEIEQYESNIISQIEFIEDWLCGALSERA